MLDFFDFLMSLLGVLPHNPGNLDKNAEQVNRSSSRVGGWLRPLLWGVIACAVLLLVVALVVLIVI